MLPGNREPVRWCRVSAMDCETSTTSRDHPIPSVAAFLRSIVRPLAYKAPMMLPTLVPAMNRGIAAHARFKTALPIPRYGRIPWLYHHKGNADRRCGFLSDWIVIWSVSSTCLMLPDNLDFWASILHYLKCEVALSNAVESVFQASSAPSLTSSQAFAPAAQSRMPYFFILRHKVVRSMPSSCAALRRWPLVFSNAMRMRRCSWL